MQRGVEPQVGGTARGGGCLLFRVAAGEGESQPHRRDAGEDPAALGVVWDVVASQLCVRVRQGQIVLLVHWYGSSGLVRSRVPFARVNDLQ